MAARYRACASASRHFLDVASTLFEREGNVVHPNSLANFFAPSQRRQNLPPLLLLDELCTKTARAR
jgi:hypothetical protein